ncbi:hypothetical protein KSP40_PGU016136 [Platanthera guangdongensis]|uniref:Uncharacterized protein n=1 Tax=Platanthera guangdongensis TaxID=2320717 RepID=A0ABR2LET0_9ASPA
MQYEADFDEQEEKLEELFLEDDPFQPLEVLIGPVTEAELVSSEDLTWADSCLVADAELPTETWISLKEALLDSITAFATCYEEKSAARNGEDGAGEERQMELDEDPVAVYKDSDTDDDDEKDDGGEVEIGDINKDSESRESIFRVWDLRVVEEEDVFLTELKRAVAESIIREKQRLRADEASIVGDEGLDELISSMGDLALEPLL